MFHFRYNVKDWPQAIAKLPPNYAIKAVDNVQLLAEAKATNVGIIRILRHFTNPQVPGATYQESRVIAASWFDTFIDGTYINGSTAGIPHQSTEYVEDFNEYAWFASQTPEEKLVWANWSLAVLDIWYEKYWPMFGTNLCVGNVPIGNDCDIRVAERVAQLTNVSQGKIPRIGYHSYWPVRNNVIPGISDGGEWKYYSGRWTTLDQTFRAAGLTVHWALTEAGAVGYHGDWPNIGLNPNDGWLKDDVHGGNIDQYLETIRYFMDRWSLWNRQHGHRCLSPNLYDSYMADDPAWKEFQIFQPNLNKIADFVAPLYKPKPPTTELPPPPPPPPVVCIDTNQYTKYHLLRPKNINMIQWQTIIDMMTDAVELPGVGKVVIGYEGWSHLDAMGAIRQSIEAGFKGSRLIVLDGDQIGSGLDKEWMIDNCPLLVPYTIWLKSEIIPIPLWLYPIQGQPVRVNHPFNELRDYDGDGIKTDRHEGLDLYANYGNPILASRDGTVIWASDKKRSNLLPSKYGWHVIIDHNDGYITWYAHMNALETFAGAIVKQGDVIGYAGSSGNSTGVHLHWTVQHIGHGLSGYVIPDVIDPTPLFF